MRQTNLINIVQKRRTKMNDLQKDGAGEKRSAMGWSSWHPREHHLDRSLRHSRRVRGDGTCGRYEVSRH